MSWYRIEGGLPQHEKYAPLSDAAFRLAITAGAWCSSRLTDGKIPRKMVQCLTRAPLGDELMETVQELLDAGIWEESPEDDSIWMIHDFLDWNLSKAQWETKVAAGSAGGRAKAAAKYSKPLAGASRTLEHPLEQNASTCSSVPLADSDSDSDLRSLAKDRTVAAEDLTGITRPEPPRPPQLVTRRERSRADLSELPIADLAKRWRENPTWVAESSPQSRQELVSASEAWDASVGLAPRSLGHPGRDAGTRALLELYADGVSQTDVLRACGQAKLDGWICGRDPGRPGDQPRKRRIDCLSHAVLRRLLDAADAERPSSVNPRVAAMLAEERKRMGQTA